MSAEGVRWPSLNAAAWLAAIRRSPPAVALAALLVGAVALRVYALASYWPADLSLHDAADYIRAAHVGLVRGDQEPSGYPVFLRAMRTISHQLGVTVAAQHLLGLATGGLLFATVRRAGGPRGLALVPAAAVWLNADQLFLEHTVLSEALFTTLVAAAIYCAVRSLQAEGARWPLLAGALTAGLLAVRTVSLPLTPLLLVWLALGRRRTRRPARRSVALAAVAALVVWGAYAAIRHPITGHWSLLPEASGRILYARAAAFADCRKFTPPRGTASLCESTPPSRRPGPIYYEYIGGPAVATFGEPPAGDGRLAAFARAAIIHQPLDYLGTVGTDLAHYVDESAPPVKPWDYAGPEAQAFTPGAPRVDPAALNEARAYYAAFRIPGGSPARWLYRYQRSVRVGGIALLVLALVGLAGAFAAREQARWGLVAILGAGLELVLFPPLTHAEWRFAIPAVGPLSAAAALGAWALGGRLAASQFGRAVGRARRV